MNRGTLMVLKRLIVTTLSAFGMGALLAVGPASAQGLGGQIPAPDAYGDPAACAASIKAATAAADMGEVGDNGLTPLQTAALTNMARACAGDVGAGIAKARTLWQAAVDAKAELDAAEKAYEADDSARNMEKRDEAKTAHDMAVAARNAYSRGDSDVGGAIYEAVYAEEDRIADANTANSAWMKAYAAAGEAQTLRDAVEYEDYINRFAGFDSDGAALEYETYTVQTVKAVAADPDNNVAAVEAEYETYVRIKKQGGGYVAPVRQDPTDDTSALVVPDSLDETRDYEADGTVGSADTSFRVVTIDHDLDAETDMISFVALTTNDDALEADAVMFSTVDDDGMVTGGIEFDYKAAKDALAAATKAVADNQDLDNVTTVEEAERKAQAVYDFFAAQKASAEKDLAAGKLKVDRMGDNPETDPVETTFVIEDTDYTVEDYEALTDLEGAATDAAGDLKEAYDDRVAATDDLEAKQRETQSYLEQLVKLREYEQAVADAARPDDAEEDTKAQMDAAEALATAEAQLASFNGLQALDEANPVRALVTSLLKADGDDGDDDGQALVDAIDATYQTANDAMTAVEGLGGDDGTVAQNTGRVGAVEAEIGLDADGMGTVTLPDGTTGSRVDDIEAKLMLKKQYIDNLGAEVGFNAATMEGMVELADGTMGSRIDKNAEDIVAGDNAVRGEFAAEDTAIRGEFAAEDTAIRGEFAAEDTAIRGEFAAADTAVRSEFAAADTAVRSEFAAADTMVRSDFAAADTGLSNRIGSNESAIQRNTGMISDLTESMEVIRAGVAASMALAGMPAINGRGISIGVGSYDGESAFAVGFQIQGEMASFQIGVTSSGGETGASAGVGFQF